MSKLTCHSRGEMVLGQYPDGHFLEPLKNRWNRLLLGDVIAFWNRQPVNAVII
jgi:hypothetical protein